MTTKQFPNDHAQACANAIDPLLHFLSIEGEHPQDILTMMYENHMCMHADGMEPHQIQWHTQFCRAVRETLNRLEPIHQEFERKMIAA